MHVDDRLATVLAGRAAGENQVRVQYRQLLDLLGTTPADARSDLIDAALLRLAELGRAIPAAVRARAVAEPGLRLRNPRLVAELAHDHPRVAAAMVGNARLSEEQWLDLLPVLPAAVRGQLRTRPDIGARLQQRLAQLGDAFASLPAGPDATAAAQPDRGGPAQEPDLPADAAPFTAPAIGQTTADEPLAPSPTAPEPSPAAADDQPELVRVAAGQDGIGAIVRRIAAYRRNREIAATVAANDAPQLPLSPDAALPAIRSFTFACNQSGQVTAADSAVAGMTVGLLLPGIGDPDSTAGEQFRKRQPIRLEPIALDGAPAIAGTWILDAAPEFDPAGRFTGYVGKLRRPARPAADRAEPDGDRLRQVLHELRTPVNAIQGFAELIHQQLVGPVPHAYRAVAAGIAADAAQMLAGFDELDRLVKLESRALELPTGTCDLAALVTRTMARLEGFTGPRRSGFVLQPATQLGEGGRAVVRTASDEAERLLWRLFATLAAQAVPGEVLPLTLSRRGQAVALELGLPAALAQTEDPLDAAPPAVAQPVSGSLFGTGFALRLAMAEAAAMGGKLTLNDGLAVLLLPFARVGGLTEPAGVSNPVGEASASTAG